MKDMKEALSSARKADTTHVRGGVRRYIARTCEYGNAKGYERSNMYRATGDGPHSEPTGADFERFRSYLRAQLDHAQAVLDAMEQHQANDPQLLDVEGMKRAAFAADTDPDKTNTIGPSYLPHLCGSMASGMIAIEQAIQCGLLPADPGQPWAKRVATQHIDTDAALDELTRLTEEVGGYNDERDVIRHARLVAVSLTSTGISPLIERDLK